MPVDLQLNVGRAARLALSTLAMVAISPSCGGSVAPPPRGDVGAPDGGERAPAGGSGSAVVVVCGDKQTDAHNCGACGHDCRGDVCVAGMCVSSACNPVALATGQQNVLGVAIDAARVYWTSSAGVSACPLDGCAGPPTVLTTSNHVAFHIAVGGPSVYWSASNYPSVWTCASNDCARTVSVFDPFASGQPVSDATNLYFYWGRASIGECPLGGCNGNPKILTGSMDTPAGIAVVGSMLYFLDRNSREIRECSTDGCATHERTVARGLAYGWVLAADDTNVYFVHNYSNDGVGENVMDILLCPRSGCVTPTVLVAGRFPTPWVALDATHLYWVEVGHQGTVQRCAISGCDGAPTVVASGQGWPYAMAIDATSVYWGNNEGGQIMKCAK